MLIWFESSSSLNIIGILAGIFKTYFILFEMSPSKRFIWSKMNVLNRQSEKLTRPKGVAIITGQKLGGRGKKGDRGEVSYKHTQ